MGPRWRRARLMAGTVGTVLLLVVVLGLSVLTRFPEAAIVERAQAWPLIGPAAKAFRERYLGPAPATPPMRERGAETPAPAPLQRESEPEIVVITREAREQVWVAEGTVLRSEPREDAEALGTIPGMANVALLESRGEWAWVDYRGALGWVVPLPVSGSPGLGSKPSPVLPVPARAPDSGLLERGLRSFSRAPTEYALGGYRMYADAIDPELLTHCSDLEARLEGTYRETFGVAPVGEAAEVVLLYPSRTSYETFWQLTAGSPVAAIGRTERGIVATYVGDRSATEVCATVIHELTHLVNRRAIGPALPPWLEEGTATEIAAGLAGAALDANLARLAAHRRTLPDLVDFLELDREAFHLAPKRRLHYELSGLWIRFLLEEPVLGEGLRSFLRYLAQGGPYSPDLAEGDFAAERETPTLADDLVAALGVDVDDLDARFRRWIESR